MTGSGGRGLVMVSQGTGVFIYPVGGVNTPLIVSLVVLQKFFVNRRSTHITTE